MEKFAGKISGLLQEKLALYQELLNVLEIEKKQIVKMNVEGVWAATDQKKALVSAIEKIIEKLAALFINSSVPADPSSRRLRLSEMIDSLSVSPKLKSELRKTEIAIAGCKKEISLAAGENKRYTMEYLSVIDDIFSRITRSNQKKNYSYTGHVNGGKEKHRIIHSQV